MQNSLGLNFSSLMIRVLLSFWERKAISHRGISSPAFEKRKKGQSVFRMFAVFNSKYSVCQSGR